MFRLVGRALLALATIGTIGVGVTAAQAAPVATSAPVADRRPVATPRLVDVDFDERRDVDRVSLRFRGGVPDDVSARLVRTVRDRDGDRVRLPGRVFIVLRLEEAQARGFERDVIDADLDNVRAVRLVDDGRRDDIVRVAIGLRERADVDITERNNRLVLDVDRRDRDRD
jgi:hypothetical protein